MVRWDFLTLVGILMINYISCMVIRSISTVNCGRNKNFSLGSFEWIIDIDCPEIWSKEELEWKDYPVNESVRMHLGRIFPSQVAEIIIPGKRLNISTNNASHLRVFTPSSTAILASCYHPLWYDKYNVNCTNGPSINEIHEEEICIFSENVGYLFFQHHYINTTPTRGLALEIQKRFYPNAKLIANLTGPTYDRAYIENTESASCSLILFLTPVYAGTYSFIYPLPAVVTWDCFWYGAYDHLYVSPADPSNIQTQSTTFQPHLLVYSDRKTRTPEPHSNQKFQSYLRQLAESFGLQYYYLDENTTAAHKSLIYYQAKVVVSTHGGALTNLIYMDPSSLIIEIHPFVEDKRLCYICMAAAIGFNHYAVYYETSWLGRGYSEEYYPLNVLKAIDWISGVLNETISRQIVRVNYGDDADLRDSEVLDSSVKHVQLKADGGCNEVIGTSTLQLSILLSNSILVFDLSTSTGFGFAVVVVGEKIFDLTQYISSQIETKDYLETEYSSVYQYKEISFQIEGVIANTEHFVQARSISYSNSLL